MEEHNSSNKSHCERSSALSLITINFQFVTYFILSPIHSYFGVPIHTLCLLSFYKHVKSNSVYIYHIFMVALETAVTLFFLLYSFSLHWCLLDHTRQDLWCHKSYFIAFYASHLSIPLMNIFTTIPSDIYILTPRAIILFPRLFERFRSSNVLSIYCFVRRVYWSVSICVLWNKFY